MFPCCVSLILLFLPGLTAQGYGDHPKVFPHRFLSPNLTSLGVPCALHLPAAAAAEAGESTTNKCAQGQAGGKVGVTCPEPLPPGCPPSLQKPSRSYSILTVVKPLWTHKPSYPVQILLLLGRGHLLFRSYLTLVCNSCIHDPKWAGVLLSRSPQEDVSFLEQD